MSFSPDRSAAGALAIATRARPTRLAALVSALLACGWGTGAVANAQAHRGASATLHVSLSPDRPGASTTIDFGFQIQAPKGGLPPALIGMAVRLPSGMRIDTQGLAVCARAALLTHGPEGCSSNAQVGVGSVYVQVPLGTVIRPERAHLTVFNGPRQNGNATLLFYAAGRLPIATQLIFSAVIVPGARRESIDASIPLIPTLPNAPDAAIVSLTSTLGTIQHAYYRIVGGRRARIAPRGVAIPGRCPPAGLEFSARFRFKDASPAEASNAVACFS